MKHTPTVTSRFRESYSAARNDAAAFRKATRAWLVVSGNDRASYLQGMLTNDTVALRPGQGCYAAYLTPQGRMIADMGVYETGDVILLGLLDEVKDVVLTKLDQFIFSEDVKLGDVSGTFTTMSIVGPRAASVVDSLLGTAAASLPLWGNVKATYRGETAILLRPDDFGVDGFDLLVDVARAEALVADMAAAGVAFLDDDVVETLRVEGGVPLFHRDMDEQTIPLEAGLESRAISQTKGCYVGQEVIIRVLHRGHGRVAKRLVGFLIDDEPVPERGTVVQSDERAIGSVTSAVWSPMLGRPIAMGYVHRDFLAPGTIVTIGARPAVVSSLPFLQ